MRTRPLGAAEPGLHRWAGRGPFVCAFLHENEPNMRAAKVEKAAMALTAKEMNAKYRETSEGGLAMSVTLC